MTYSPADNPWTPERVKELRAGAAEGLSSGAMASKFGFTRMSVIGKCRRLRIKLLAPAYGGVHRRRKGDKPPPPPHQTAKAVTRRVGAVSLPALASVADTAPPPVPAPAPRMTGQCCWPIGEPGTRGFRYCDAECDSRRTYCTEHHQLAHQKRRMEVVA